MLFQKKYLIGQELVRRGLLSQDNLDFALIEHERQGMKLGQILIKCGFISEDDLLQVLSDQLGLSVYRVNDAEIAPEIIRLVPDLMARKHKMIPVTEQDGALTVCMSEPFEQKEIEEIQQKLKKKLTVVMDSDKNVLRAIKKYYGLTDNDDLDFIDDDEDDDE